MPISPFVPVMDKMQGPHPTHGSTHVCSFSPPSASELSPQYLATPYHSSQALLWNNYKKPPQDSIQDTLWSPQWTEPQIPSSPPDFWNTLQLNHTSVDNLPLAASSVVSVDSPDNAVLGVDSALRLSDGGRTVKPESFPLSVVSGPRPIPFACRLDMATAKSREVSFAKISAYNKDLERNSRVKDGVPASVKVEMDDSPNLASQGNGSSLHSVREREREERGSESMEMLVQKDMQKQGDEFGGTIASSLGDSTIVLKLGKRTYLEHSSAGVEGNQRAAGASIAKNPKSNGGNNNGNSNGGTIKRHKALSPTVNIPRCQAEDCNADLSDAKGYHRRHKVCEWHSKSSKVKVASIEQRFCQQCSRFHVLSEFDEGKRSCRRRLAGHNERRRKQQPEPMSLLSAANYAHVAGGKHLLSTSLLDHFYFLQHKRASMFSCLDSAALTGHPGVVEADLQGLKLQHHPKQKPVTNLPAAELHHFMWGSRERDGNLVGRGAQALTVANDHGLEQSNPGGPSTMSAACLIPVPHQPPPEVSGSRRALSLLSSSFGSPNNSCSMSMSLGVSLPSIEGLLTENHCATASCLTMSSSSSCFMSNSGKGMEVMPLLQTHGITTLASPDKGAVIHSSSMDHVQPSTIPNFDGSSMFLMVPENGFQGSQYSRPVLDLMQVSSSEPQQQVEIQFTDLEGLSMFGRHSMM